MSIYEIDEAVRNLVDPETGELHDYETFCALQMARETKIENVACWCVNLRAEAAAIQEQEKALSARRAALENRLERLKQYLDYALNGQKFSSPRVAVSFRDSERVKIDPAFFENVDNERYFRIKEPEADKKEIKDALKAGANIPGAALVSARSVIIK